MGCCEGIESLVTSLLFKLRIINHIYLKIQRLYFTILLLLLSWGLKNELTRAPLLGSAILVVLVVVVVAVAAAAAAAVIVLLFSFSLLFCFFEVQYYFILRGKNLLWEILDQLGCAPDTVQNPSFCTEKWWFWPLDWRGFLSDTPLMFGQLPT